MNLKSHILLTVLLVFSGAAKASPSKENSATILLGVPSTVKDTMNPQFYDDVMKMFGALNAKAGYKTKVITLPKIRGKLMLKNDTIDIEIGRIASYNKGTPNVLKSNSVFTQLSLILLKNKFFDGPKDIRKVMSEKHPIGYIESTLFIKYYLSKYKQALPLSQRSDFFAVLEHKRMPYVLTFALYYLDTLIGIDPKDRKAYTSYGGVIESIDTYNFFSKSNSKLMDLYDKHLGYNSNFRRSYFKTTDMYRKISTLPADHVARVVYLRLIQCDESIFKEE
ncbi:hypothetical protein N9W79_01995 [bacterium]|nr:hypothetical protein [bacterium]